MNTADSPNYTFGFPLEPDFAKKKTQAKVSVIMGSRTDWLSIKPAADTLEDLRIPFEFGVVSAHRTPERMEQYARTAKERGIRVIIACAGGSAHLPGMIASSTLLPTLGVAPKKEDIHAVGSMIAMPAGKPLGYMGANGVNAALMAARILALCDENIRRRLQEYDDNLRDSVPLTCF